jgi:ribonuclease PH
MTSIKRFAGRSCNQLRFMHITHETFGYADGSVLFQMGRTKVLCSITLQNGVPPFLKGKRTGWLNAEYAMLPIATKQRTQRAQTLAQQNGRTVEISRLISRVLRTIVDLDKIGERTIVVDCDVLQADGGTRAAAITGASIALLKAQEHWLKHKIITEPFLLDEVAAISVGVLQEECLLDIDFAEDSIIDADFNVILTKSNKIVEIQGTAEKAPVSWEVFEHIKQLASEGVQQIFAFIEQKEVNTEVADSKAQETVALQKNRTSMFSLQNRLNLS